MIKNVIFAASIALNGLLINILYFPKTMTLAEVASKHSNSKNYDEYYQSLGSYFTQDMRSLAGDKMSILYNESKGVLYLYDGDGPILGYGSNSVEVYPLDFKGSFHDRAPGMLYFERDLNVLSYYNGDRFKIGSLDAYPELILDTSEKEVNVGLPYYLERDPGNKVEGIFKGGQECKFIEPDTNYFACCSAAQDFDGYSKTLAEGFVYWPFNEPRWLKIKENANLDQGVFDQVCNALYDSKISPDHELRRRLGEHFINLDTDGFKNELQNAGDALQD